MSAISDSESWRFEPSKAVRTFMAFSTDWTKSGETSLIEGMAAHRHELRHLARRLAGGVRLAVIADGGVDGVAERGLGHVGEPGAVEAHGERRLRPQLVRHLERLGEHLRARHQVVHQ